ncbi:MAG: alpha amylase family protein [Candidatus Cryptobacteroides sp.]|jgi:uncharacterized lipoprotein YddW (UPF0748 family)|nr:alpha amylase family protein [Candidatus Cryptobacteroides sp.]
MHINKLIYSLAIMASLSLVSCSGDDDKIPDWPWKENGDTSEVVKTEKPRFVWIDAGGNFQRFANSKENISEDIQKVKDAGFSGIIVDVRPTTGDVLFSSSKAEKVKRIDIWEGSSYKWLERTATWDYLQAFIDEGHELGLTVYASINTFVGGYLCPYGLGSEGMLFRDKSKKSWATVINSSSGPVSTMDLLDDSSDYGAKFLNPANDDVQDYVISILKDLAKYDVDGIVLDRCRYDDYGLMSDFSDISRNKFEKYIGKSVTNYPSDIMAAGTTSIPSIMPEYFKPWLEFRAKTICDFVVKAKNAVKGQNSKIKFGVYVGAWYSDYYGSGVNWASKKYDTSKDYSWASPEYKNYGYAGELDFMFLGAYAGSNSIYGSGEWTMQGFAQQAQKLLCDDVWFACGPDIGNGTGWSDGGKGDLIPDAINACITPSDGFFVFDLCHIRSFNYWDDFKKGFERIDANK